MSSTRSSKSTRRFAGPRSGWWMTHPLLLVVEVVTLLAPIVVFVIRVLLVPQAKQEELAALALVREVGALRLEVVIARLLLHPERMGLNGYEERAGSEDRGRIDDPARLPGAEVPRRGSVGHAVDARRPFVR